MNDLYLGVLIMGGLSFVLYWFALVLWDRLSPLMMDVLAVATVVGTILYAFRLRDNIILSRLLPFSNLVVLSNLFPPAAGFLAGIAWNRVPGANWRKAVSTWSLLGIAVYSAVMPITGVAPLCQDRWIDGVCLQTSGMTCSPASATTLLSHFDIKTSEQEMAELCLTRNGTTWQGLYHGLAVKLKDSRRTVQIFESTLAELRELEEFPVILSVELRQEDAGVFLEYEQKMGWEPDTRHTVVLFGFDRFGDALIGDPAVGLDHWSPKDLDVLWHGRGMRVVSAD